MLQVNSLSIIFGERILLENVSFTLRPKDRVALVGKNGAGKSTLMRAINSEMSIDGGNISKPNEYTIGFLRQEIRQQKEKTLYEEVRTAFAEAIELERRLHEMEKEFDTRTDYSSDSYMKLLHDFSEVQERLLYLDYENIDKNLELVLKGLGFKRDDLEKAPSTFSGGWAIRIELAKLLLQKPDLLLLDEPTNHLDIESIIWLENFLKRYEGAVLLVSHDRTFLDNVTNKTLEIEFGRISEYKANYTKYLELKKERKELQEASFKNQQQEIKEIQRNIDRFRAKANKASFAQSLIKKLDRMDMIEVDDEDNASLKFRFPDARQSGKVVVNIKHLNKSFGPKHVLRNIELEVERGEKIAFVGKNGMGKTTLSRIMVGDLNKDSGLCDLGYNVETGYYAQHHAEKLPGDLTIFDYMDRSAVGDIRTQVRRILGCFLFSGGDVDKKIKVLSGGERSRLCIAHMLLEPSNLLVLDEPTNHLDLRSKAVLKEAVKDFKGTVIIVSHDRDFLDGLTDKVVEFREDGIKTYLGDIKYFLSQKEMEDMRAVEMEKKATQTPAKTESPKKEDPFAGLSFEERKLMSKEEKSFKRKIIEIEKEISDLEKKQWELEEKMSGGDQSFLEEYQRNHQLLQERMETWENMELQYEEKFSGFNA